MMTAGSSAADWSAATGPVVRRLFNSCCARRLAADTLEEELSLHVKPVNAGDRTT
jgi:hypothetical protein